MFKITPKGFNNLTNPCISIPFDSVKSCQDLKTKLENEHNLPDGILVYNYSTYTLSLYFDEGFASDDMHISYINPKECVTLNVELFDRSLPITMHINDNLFSAIHSISFVIANRRYNYFIENNQISIYKKLQNIMEFKPNVPYYEPQNTIKIVQVE